MHKSVGNMQEKVDTLTASIPHMMRTPSALTCVGNKIPRKIAAAADGAFEQRREALKQCLKREYTSLFRPFEEEFYSEDISFTDPLKSLKGKASYKDDIETVTGQSVIGKALLSDNFLDLHAVEDVPGDPTRLRTRWTVSFVFKLLPWKPKVLFSGVSEYAIDPVSAIVLSQRDYWDTLSLQDGGSYVPSGALEGVVDLLGQLLPAPLQPAKAQEPATASGTSWQLLRKARAYRIYRADDLVFALDAPACESGLQGVEQELKVHGLIPGQRMKIKGIEVIQIQSPHPWDHSL